MKPCQCPICQDVFENLDNIAALTCGHVFHNACVSRWLTEARKSCPTCRTSVATVKLRDGLIPSLFFSEIDEDGCNEVLESGSIDAVRALYREQVQKCAEKDTMVESLNTVVQEMNSDNDRLARQLERAKDQVETERGKREVMKRRLAHVETLEGDYKKVKTRLDKQQGELNAVRFLQSLLDTTTPHLDYVGVSPEGMLAAVSLLRRKYTEISNEKEAKSTKIASLEAAMKKMRMDMGKLKEERDMLKEELKVRTIDSTTPLYNPKVKKVLDKSSAFANRSNLHHGRMSLSDAGNRRPSTTACSPEKRRRLGAESPSLFDSPVAGPSHRRLASPDRHTAPNSLPTWKLDDGSPDLFDSPDPIRGLKPQRSRKAQDFVEPGPSRKKHSPTKRNLDFSDLDFDLPSFPTASRNFKSGFRKPGLPSQKSSAGVSDGLGGTTSAKFQARKIPSAQSLPGPSHQRKTIKRSNSNISNEKARICPIDSFLAAQKDRTEIVSKKPKLSRPLDTSLIDLTTP